MATLDSNRMDSPNRKFGQGDQFDNIIKDQDDHLEGHRMSREEHIAKIKESLPFKIEKMSLECPALE